MSSEHSRLRPQEQHRESEISVGQQQGIQFATVDHLLRYDSEQNPVPPEVGDRLGKSIAAEPKSQRSWFRKLLG